MSSVKELARRWYPRAYFNSPEKNGNHRALADIRDSIAELRYYREAVFVPQPGPDSDTAKDDRGASTSLPASGVASAGTGPPGASTGPSGERGREHPLGPCTLFLGRSGKQTGPDMVGIAQLVEHLVVVQDVAGSSPVTHPD